MLFYLKISVFRYLAIMACIIPILLGIFLDKSLPKRYFLVAIFLVIHFCIALYTSSFLDSIKFVLQDFFWFVPIFIFDVIQNIQEDKKKEVCTKIFKLMSIVIGYCVIRSIIYASSNPYAIRAMANFDVTENPEGVPLAIGGGYPLIFSLIILVPYMLYCITKYRKTNKKKTLYMLIAFISMFLLLITANVTTAVLLTALGCVCVVNSNKIIQNISFAIILFILGILFIFEPLIFIPIIDFIASFFNADSIIYVRIQEIIPVLYGNMTSSAFSDRIMLAERSLNSIWIFPLLGAGSQVGYYYDSLTLYIGHHCEWLDFIATYGIFLGGIFSVFLFSSIKSLFNTLPGYKSKSVYIVLTALLIIMGFLDPVLSTNAFLMFFVYIPCAEYALGRTAK